MSFHNSDCQAQPAMRGLGQYPSVACVSEVQLVHAYVIVLDVDPMT